MSTEAYLNFLRAKVCLAPSFGFGAESIAVSEKLLAHQKAIVPWMIRGGRRALFASFGLGKTCCELEVARICAQHERDRSLIILPLGVRQEFVRDALTILGWDTPPAFIRSIDDAGPRGVYLTNYETVRDGKIDPREFVCVILDEGDVLRGFGGTKTFREFMRVCAGDGKTLNERVRGREVKYRFVATATPSPNDYIEILAYAAFLGIMEVSQAKTRFFKRDSTKADQLTLHPHKEGEFWMWVSSWALFITRPSDLGSEYSDAGYVLPELDLRWHEVPSDHSTAGHEKDGQQRMFANAAVGVSDSAREKRRSMDARVAKMMDIRAEDPDGHRVIWHDLEDERRAIEGAIPGIATVYGSQALEVREELVAQFSDGEIAELAAKPVMLGSGCNLQRHCHQAIFLGIGFKFKDFIQAVHRVQRFLQRKRVRIDLIYTEAERETRRTLERKWRQHNTMVKHMTDLIKEYGLSHIEMAAQLTRALGVVRVEVGGDNYTMVNNDCVLETQRMPDNSVDLILTSIPFSTQYEYSPNYADFGHSDNNAHFFSQLDFLTPQLHRVLKPGRSAFIHVKDRIVPMGMTGAGSQTVYPFHCETIAHFSKHGFVYMGMATIVTDVVRENNQTYRLGWTEQCKDASKMGFGMPEYLLQFRKPPTDTSNAYADVPVTKSKQNYSRGRWQVDAHGFHRSSGNRPITAQDLEGLPHEGIFKAFRDYNLANVYDFEHHVRIAEHLDAKGVLPTTFMLLQPPSWHPDVMTDITRMLTLNGSQSAKGKEMHLCPMQFDLADRVIEQHTMPGEVVFDPFAGLGTVPYRALLIRDRTTGLPAPRRGIGIELSKPYFLDACMYLKAAEQQAAIPDLFAALEAERDSTAA